MMKNPIFLVHGITDTGRVFKKMSAYLRELGFPVHAINLYPNDGTGNLIDLAIQLKNHIDINSLQQQKINLIGFSMGGLVTRFYLQRLGGINKVKRYISISAPNNGTLMAYLLPATGIKQMRPHSDFLQDLNCDAGHLLSSVDLTVMWTPFDLMILPANSSQMSVGREIEIPVLTHKWMLRDARVLNQIKSLLLAEY